MLHKRVYYTKVGLSILQMCKKWIITFLPFMITISTCQIDEMRSTSSSSSLIICSLRMALLKGT